MIAISQQQKAVWEAKLEALENEVKWLDNLERISGLVAVGNL